MRLLWGYVFLVFLIFPVHFAKAHQAGESYIYLNVGEDRLSGRYEIPLRDAGLLFDLDADGDGDVSEREFEARLQDIQAHFQPRIAFQIGGS